MEPEATVTITLSLDALKQFWDFQDGVYNALGPAGDDVAEAIAASCPRAEEVFDALSIGA